MATNGRPTRKEVERWRKRSDSHAIAATNMENMAKAAGREVQRLEGTVLRLNAELLAAHNSLMVLSEDGNTRYDAANAEVQRLRELCIAGGIDPNI